MSIRKSGLVLIPALFILFSCNINDIEVGLPPKDNQFEIVYHPEVFDPKVTWRDSIYTGQTGRLLTGSYTDPNFGVIEAIGYTLIDPDYYAPTTTLLYKADSAKIFMGVDYTYGENIASQSNFEIYTIPQDYLYNRSDSTVYSNRFISSYQIPFAGLIGTGTYNKSDTSVMVANLDIAFAEYFLNSLTSNNEGFKSLFGIENIFPGIAIKGDVNNNGIFGFDLMSESSRIILYYTDPNGDPQQYYLGFGGSNSTDRVYTINHNYITPNPETPSWAGTDLDGLTQLYQDFTPATNNLYFQGSTGINSTFDISSLYSIGDTLFNVSGKDTTWAIVNSAVLEITDLIFGVGDTLAPPSELQILLTDNSNKRIFLDDTKLVQLYKGIASDTASIKLYGSQNLTPLTLKYSKDYNKYSADITLFIQSIVNGKREFNKLMLYEGSPIFSVNRFVADKNNISIRFYYTKPK
ncbi:MAG: DUF4270 domain-containing protein [Cyclobacteriaceae bacterium]|nr:DUF4270 domain-containing protein [Cyclobacteriaceae bacterium]